MSVIFNSLGSNYRGKQAIKYMFRGGHETDILKLSNYLTKRFDGKKTFLFYKGREALHQALRAAGISKGSLVAINGFTCYAVDEAIAKAGLAPAYLDINPDMLHFSADTLEAAVRTQPNIRAVIIQNTLGFPCDIVAIEKVAKKHKLVLIEDLAHSFGLIYPDGREAGTVGDFTMLSFGRDKGVDAVSGGALVVRSKITDNWEQKFLKHGHDPSMWRQFVDRLYPFNTWSVRVLYSIGLGKYKQTVLRVLGFLPRATDGDFDGFTRLPSTYAREILRLIKEHPKDLEHRQHVAAIYREHLPSDIVPAIAREESVGNSTTLRFPIRVYERELVLENLKKENIHISDTWYDSPIAPPRFMNKTAYSGQCENAEMVCGELLNLPTHRNISLQQAAFIAERIKSWL